LAVANRDIARPGGRSRQQGAPPEFGSTVSFMLNNPDVPPYQVQPYQIAQDCTYSGPPYGDPPTMQVNCKERTPPPPSPDLLSPSFCEGGPDYTFKGPKGAVCLQFAVTEPGATITLRGLNFITPSVTVRFANRTDPSVSVDVQAMVFGDQMTPVDVHDNQVSDMACVTVPNHPPGHKELDLPAGLYDVSVLVNNVTFAPDPSGGMTPPLQLESNKVILQIDPDPNVTFNLFTKHGHCYSETDGLGSDDIWWDAWVTNFKTTPTPPPAPDPLPLKHIAFNRAAWEDIDTGDDDHGFTATLWADKIGHGIVVVGLMGLEVTSDAAAREGITKFSDAFNYFLQWLWDHAIGLGDVAGAIAKAVSVTITDGLIALAVIAAVVLIIGLVWASWAKADQMAIDIFTLNPRQAWDRTTDGGQLPAAEHVEYGTDFELSTSHTPIGKDKDVGGAMVYSVEHQYWSGEEDSHYGLTFQLSRV
jgi:hypothetical protein